MFKLIKLSDCFFLLSVFSIFAILNSTVKDGWDQNFWMNMGTGLLCSLLLIFTADFIIKKDKQLDIRRRKQIAFKRLRRPIVAYLSVLAQMYKATTVSPDTNFKSPHELINDEFLDVISHLNLLSEAPIFPSRTWSQYLSEGTNQFKVSVESVITNYGDIIDAELLEILENINDDPFVKFVFTLPNVHIMLMQREVQQTVLPFCFANSVGQQHFLLLLKLVEFYNLNSDCAKIEQIPINLLADHESPRPGVSRVEFSVSPDGQVIY